ncbi:ATP-binding protein [Kitasatospora sp. LaBMicrA B282]|uniref:ATP-binding protein n=1 Tax=Kitasatospora sp. LaBMicrA B282 TaxID=3420949 RepID=UPI003D0FD728
MRAGDLVAGDHLVTVGGVDGTEVRPCPPEHRPAPRRRPGGQPGQGGRTTAGPGPTPAVGPLALGTGPGDLPLLDRDAQVAQLLGKLAEGRSIRLLGAPGSGRSSLLAAVAAGSAQLAPHGVIRLCGHRRDADDLLQDLFAAAWQAPGFRPSAAQLPELLASVGAIVVIDEVEQGGTELERLMAAAPECAFLVVPAPGADRPLPPDSRLEDHTVGGLTRPACLALTARLAGRRLDDAERAWAVDLWFESQGLPLRFVQAAALLRRRDLAVDALLAAEEDRQSLFGRPEPEPPLDADPAVREAELRAGVPLPSVAEAAAPALLLVEGLGEAAETVLRLAVALGGECPTAPHLPALIDVDHGESALRELVDCGLAESIGGHHHRLTTGVQEALAAHWGPDAESTAGAAQHFSWWVGHGSVSTEQIAAEAEVVLGALRADRAAGRLDAVLRLARSAAPALALTLRWGVWRQVLELGLEVARQSGRQHDEAWFQHELGAYWLCVADGVTAGPGPARAALEAACALRGAAGENRQLDASRRLLALLQESELARVPAASEEQTQVIRRPVIRVLAERSRAWPATGVLRGWTRRNAVLAGGGLLAVSAVGVAVALGFSGSSTSSPAGGGSTGVTGSVLTSGGGATPSAGGSTTAALPSATATDSAAASASASGSASATATPSASASKGRTTATPSAQQGSGTTAPDNPAQPAPVQPGQPGPGTPWAPPPVQPSSQPVQPPSPSSQAPSASPSKTVSPPASPTPSPTTAAPSDSGSPSATGTPSKP